MSGEEHQKLVMKTVEYFKAIGDYNRMSIIKILASNMRTSIGVAELARILKISQPATSQHLKILKNVNLLKSKKEGNYNFYYINLDVFKDIKDKFDILYELAFIQCSHFKIEEEKHD